MKFKLGDLVKLKNGEVRVITKVIGEEGTYHTKIPGKLGSTEETLEEYIKCLELSPENFENNYVLENGTGVKDLDWLEDRVFDLMPDHTEMYGHPDNYTVHTVTMVDKFLELIRQVNNPTPSNSMGLARMKEFMQGYGENVNEKWKDGLYKDGTRDTINVFERMLEESGELSLPEIPECVVVHIKEYKDHDYSIADIFHSVLSSIKLVTEPSDTMLWIAENPEEFADAYRFGFTVEDKKDKAWFRKELDKFIEPTPADGEYLGLSGKVDVKVVLELLHEMDVLE